MIPPLEDFKFLIPIIIATAMMEFAALTYSRLLSHYDTAIDKEANIANIMKILARFYGFLAYMIMFNDFSNTYIWVVFFALTVLEYTVDYFLLFPNIKV